MNPQARETPAMQQYRRFKERHPGCILLFRIGDFYETFYDDAATISKALGLTLTARGDGVPLAGVPHHQLENYLRKLTARGFRVAVCEQLIDASQAKGVVPRAVTRVITPGTLVDETLLEADASVAVAAVAAGEDRNTMGVAIAEVSTGQFLFLSTTPAGLQDECLRRGVREVIAADAKALPTLPNVRAHERPAWHFRAHESAECIRAHYRVQSLEAFGLREGEASACAAGALLRYLQETQTVAEEDVRELERQGHTLRRGSLAHLRPPRRVEAEGFLALDAVSLRALEIERTLRETADSSEGTLVGVFAGAGVGKGTPRTPMGRRLLRSWLSRPACDMGVIVSRQQAVALLVSDAALTDHLAGALGNVQDLARIAGRIALARATPRDIVALATSVRASLQIAEGTRACPALQRWHEVAARCARSLAPLAEEVSRLCVPSPPATLREGGIIRDGVDAELDEARLLERDAGSWLAAYQTRLIDEHRLPGLKVGFNKVAGYFIELPQAQARTAPPQLKRMQTLRSAERFTTPELSDFERKVTTARARGLEREKELFLSLCDRAGAHTDDLSLLGEAIAELDVLLAFADKARVRGWTRPEMTEQPVLELRDARHPVLDESLAAACVPNDCVLGVKETLALITGPNMAGKSTYIRTAALLTILAHAGSFLPAAGARIGLTDRVFTRLGADDALHAGQSTFMVEMIETARILLHATPRSLVVLDEVGRGTSTLDGLSLAWAIAEHLALPPANQRGPRALFATHYHELTVLAERLAGKVKNLHVLVREWPGQSGHGEIVFLHRVAEGSTDQSYGVHVAQLAGMPHGVVARAREVLAGLAVQHAGAVSHKGARERGMKVPDRQPPQLGLFREYIPHPAVDALREVKIETMTPLAAFDALRTIKAMADAGENAAAASESR